MFTYGKNIVYLKQRALIFILLSTITCWMSEKNEMDNLLPAKNALNGTALEKKAIQHEEKVLFFSFSPSANEFMLSTDQC